MVFKKLFGALGVGAPSVDTVLSAPDTRPGLTLTGQVHIAGGQQPADLVGVFLGLVTRVEVESGDSEYDTTVEFHRVPVAGAMHLPAGQRVTVPFQFPVPWETPVTTVYGQHLHGMTLGLRTELAIARAVDQGDLDPVRVHPLLVQERILDAFGRLGFRFTRADLERGRIHGIHQTLPFFQEIEFLPPPQYAHSVNQVELTFVADPHSVHVVLEFDKRGGLFTEGRDTYARFTVPHAGAERVDWVAEVDNWLRQALDQHRGRMSGHGGYAPGYPPANQGYAPGYPGGHQAYGPGYPPAQYGQPYGHHGHGGHSYGHHGSGHHGVGAGAVVAGAAVGAVGGLVAGEMIEEAFEDGPGDFFEDSAEEFFGD